ncbi:prolipoprotein diacylglyceryl transferase [Brachybacterium muris]|uniref:prolipoprotein diacylglyceryl transferase n=1 Tax=Brachybacterium muris TaxID=219301 RepID=UPI0021E4BB1F|nr:prolipoprotein diacylglyceryl transferase [Brachybacterium muris]MCT2296204.1 prolipoprotein diacylglyceryl transferase [Brachybacterium muris]
MSLALIPSPPISAISLGPLTLYFYAVCILAGIGVALWWATKRWEARGGNGDDLFDIVFVAVFAGIIGARIWHVLTSPAPFFGPGGDPVSALYIWEGGLAIYGAVAGGALAVYLMARAKGVSFTALADTIAPTLMVAQAIGRLGNWFNQELYGPPTDLPWGWDITCVTNGDRIGGCEPGTYHPTFLYEQLWLLAGMALLLFLSRRLHLAGGRVFWAYVAIYSTGRAFIDAIRSEPVLMVGPLRIHTLVAIVMAVVAVAVLVALTMRKQKRGGEVVAADGSYQWPDPAAEPSGPGSGPTAAGAGTDRGSGPISPQR